MGAPTTIDRPAATDAEPLVRDRDDLGPIVVGVDGSAAARGALLWADGEARRLGAPLRAVIVAQAPDLYGSTAVVEREAREVLERTVGEVLGDRARGVEMLVRTGRPVPVLREIARTAHLLAIGSPEVRRARDPWSGAVAALMPREADCPVVLVPTRDRGPR